MTTAAAPTNRIARMHIALLAICIVLLFAPSARAASMNEAGLIVDYGEGSTSWVWVPFEETEISVFDLLQRSEIDLVTVGFGGLGEAVCQIGPSGCTVEDCRKRLCQTSSSSPFWRLYVLDGDTWRMAGNGVSGTKLGDGDIAALSWGNAEPDLPVLTITELASEADANPEAADPTSSIRTVGNAAVNDDPAASWAPAASALGFVALASGVLVYRSRSDARDAA